MKKCYFVLMALFCATALFTGCSDDDDKEDEKNNGQGSGMEILSKKIVKMISHNDSGSERFIYLYDYDKNNRLSKITEVEEDGTVVETSDIVYEDNKVTITNSSSENKSVIQLQDGKAVSFIEYWDGDRIDHTYSYSGKYLSRDYAKYFNGGDSDFEEVGVADVVFTVKDANLETMSYVYTSQDKNENVKSRFEYSDLDNNICFDVYFLILNEYPFLLDVAGDRYQKLPAKIIIVDDNGVEKEVTSYTYEVDKDGYITKIIEEMENEDGYIYEITYE